jgi:hypothetical protein
MRQCSNVNVLVKNYQVSRVELSIPARVMIVDKELRYVQTEQRSLIQPPAILGEKDRNGKRK